jgi:RND family efflux transporter MFP subunit
MTLVRSAALCMVLALAMSWSTGCGGSQQPGEETPQSSESPAVSEGMRPPASASAIPVAGRTRSQAGRTTASGLNSFPTILVAKSQVTVLSRISGLVERVAREEGARARRGDILALIEAEPFKLALDRASAEAKHMRVTYEKKHALGMEGGFSLNEVDIAQAEYEKARADSAMRQLELSYTRIRAPISGHVAERRIRQGQWVGVHDELFTLVDLSTLWAVAFVPDHLLRGIEVGDPIQVRIIEEDASFSVNGTLHLNPIVDPTSGRIKITVQLLNEEQRLRPGMNVEIVLPTPR